LRLAAAFVLALGMVPLQSQVRESGPGAPTSVSGPSSVVGRPGLVVDEQAQGLGPVALEARQTHGGVDVVAMGEGMRRVYGFLPAEPAVVGKVPFVFFRHGWQGMNPRAYGALIDHLAREGNVVVFPVYQENDATSPQIVVANAAAGERAALEALKALGVEPDAQRVVYFGYSMGAAISLKLASTYVKEGLPRPQAMVFAAPGDAYHVAKGEDAKSIWPVLSELPATLPVAIVTGEQDTEIGLPTGLKLAAALCKVTRPGRLVLLVLPADEHAGKKVGAGHGSPGAPDSRYDFDLKTPLSEIPKHIAGRVGFEASASLNNLDFYGYWRVLDAVIDSVATAPSTSAKYVFPPIFFEVHARGFMPKPFPMGTWPDGTPFRQALIENSCNLR